MNAEPDWLSPQGRAHFDRFYDGVDDLPAWEDYCLACGHVDCRCAAEKDQTAPAREPS